MFINGEMYTGDLYNNIFFENVSNKIDLNGSNENLFIKLLYWYIILIFFIFFFMYIVYYSIKQYNRFFKFK